MTKTSNKVLISPSIIATDISTLGVEAKKFNPEIIDLLHMDVMDGNFVPNLTFGPGYIRDLMKHTSIPMDVHLMIEKPENSIESYIALKPWCITIHYESTRFPARILSMIRENGIIAGLSLNPGTPVESAFDLLHYTDMILIMSVDPGFYGQSFMEGSIDRLKRLSSFIDKNGYHDKIMIQIDGGITYDNIASVIEAGARIVVAGSSSFKGGDTNQNVKKLKEIAMSAL